MLIVPVPCLRIDRLTNATEHSQATQIILFDVVRPKTTQQTYSSGRGVELGDLIFVDSLPVTRRSRIDRGGFENGSCHTVGKRSVNDVTREEFIRGSKKSREDGTYVWPVTQPMSAMHANLSSGWTSNTYLTGKAAQRR
jgi:hypothetical protein